MKKNPIIISLVVINFLVCQASEYLLNDTFFLHEKDLIIKENHILRSKSLSCEEWDALIQQLYQKKMNGTYKSTNYDYVVYNSILEDSLHYHYNQLNDYRFTADLISKIVFLLQEEDE